MEKIINGYKNYSINDIGRVKNLKTNKILKGSFTESGYHYYRLSKNGKKKMFYGHRLVAEYFVPNPNNFPVVNHIDGNKINNAASNLEWVSYSENSKHFHRVIKINKRNRPQEKYKGDLFNEEWATTIGNPNYKVSSLGRVRNIKTDTLLSPSNTNGYLKVRLSLNGMTTDWLIHKLVYQSFNNLTKLNSKKYCIDHIDGNKHNNALNNLRKITYSQNVIEAFYNQKINSNIKPISQFDKNNNFIATYPSAREAGRQLCLDSSSIIKCCKNKVKTVGGFIFHYA